MEEVAAAEKRVGEDRDKRDERAGRVDPEQRDVGGETKEKARTEETRERTDRWDSRDRTERRERDTHTKVGMRSLETKREHVLEISSFFRSLDLMLALARCTAPRVAVYCTTLHTRLSFATMAAPQKINAKVVVTRDIYPEGIDYLKQR